MTATDYGEPWVARAGDSESRFKEDHPKFDYGGGAKVLVYEHLGECHPVCDVSCNYTCATTSEQEERAARIVRCVNVCAGISDEAIDEGRVFVVSMSVAIKAEHQKLLREYLRWAMEQPQ